MEVCVHVGVHVGSLGNVWYKDGGGRRHIGQRMAVVPSYSVGLCLGLSLHAPGWCGCFSKRMHVLVRGGIGCGCGMCG